MRSSKKLVSFVFVPVVLLALAVPASAQRVARRGGNQGNYGYDPLRQVVGQNLRLIDYGGRRGYRDGGYFYPVDRFGRRMGFREAIVEGLVIGSVMAAGEIIDRRRYDDQMAVPPPQSRGGVYWSHGFPVAGPYVPLAGPAAPGQGSGEWKITNRTRFRAEVYDGQRPMGFRLNPGEVRFVPVPETGYLAYALIPNAEGRLSTDRMDTEPANEGWTFVEPTFKVKE